MTTFSGMKKKLEKDYLADSLKGKITYFATTYRKSHDGDKGRASIKYNGVEILKGSTFENWEAQVEREEVNDSKEYSFMEFYNMDAYALENGMFEQCNFYNAFEIFDNQSIEESLISNNLIVKIFAILDRRVGKRRLEAMRENMKNEPDIVREFYEIRIMEEFK